MATGTLYQLLAANDLNAEHREALVDLVARTGFDRHARQQVVRLKMLARRRGLVLRRHVGDVGRLLVGHQR